MKEAQINQAVNDYLTRFSTTYAKSDKKTYKENLLPFFATQEEVKLYIKDPFPKYEERAPEKWEDAFTNLRNSGIIKILKSGTESTFL